MANDNELKALAKALGGSSFSTPPTGPGQPTIIHLPNGLVELHDADGHVMIMDADVLLCDENGHTEAGLRWLEERKRERDSQRAKQARSMKPPSWAFPRNQGPINPGWSYE